MLSLLLPTRCPLCARPGPVPCGDCCRTLPPAPWGSVPAIVAFEGPARRLLADLKYRNARLVARSFAAALAGLLGDDVEVVTWAPTTPARRRARGFDQAELLARAAAQHLGVAARCLLVRADGGHQTGRRRLDRLADPPRFTVVAAVSARVGLVDDVVTTGATLDSAQAVLRAAGAAHVIAVAAAATPHHGTVTAAPTPGSHALANGRCRS